MRDFFDFDNAEAVYYVSILGSITKAGDKMGLSQSAITRQIKMAEERSGLKLFDREYHFMRPRPEAKPYIDACHEIVHIGNAGLKNAHALRDRGVQKLEILAPPSMASVWLPRYMRGLDKRHPDLKISLNSSMSSIEPVDVDVVIRTYIQNSEELLVQKKLFDQYYGLYASPEYLEQYGEVNSLEDLDGHRLIAVKSDYENLYPHINWHLKVGSAAATERRPYVIEVDSNEAAINAMLNGLGIISTGVHHMNFLQCGVKLLLPEYLQGPIPVYYTYNKGIENTINIDNFYDYLMEGIGREANFYTI